ncbi:MAG: preprotein translocase subunit YajC [Calditrichaeota bacterium]|nr:preprotein translocase subunit YajC [Calditrichota bacterium]MCB9391941.1 preprotein translocase subunit YajC [Calditrichota bacterium]
MPETLFSPVFLTLLQADGAPQPPSMIGTLLPFILIIVVMYFLMIRPQQKRQKQHQAMLSALKSGDEVVTTGGVFGTIAGIDDKDGTLWLKISGDVKVRLDRGAVARVISQ